MSKRGKVILLTSDDDRDKSPSTDIDNFDIDDSAEPQNKKIFRKKVRRTSNTNTNKKKYKSIFCDSSDDDTRSEPSDSEQSLMSISGGWSSSGPKGTTGTKRSVLQRFKHKVQHRNDRISDDASDKKTGRRRRGRLSDDDSDDEYYDDFSFCDKRDNITAAWKCRDNAYEGDGLEAFYRETLGIESPSNSDDDLEIMKPMKKKRKLNEDTHVCIDRNKFKSKLAENQFAESFGNLPLSQDLIDKIGRYMTLIEVSQILVLINHEFCGYFNTDKYWEKLYCSLSKKVMNTQQIKVIKSYIFCDKTSNKLYKRRILWYYTTIGSIHSMEHNVFDDILKEYMEHNNERVFVIKLYLVKALVIMHYNKQNGIDIDEYGIDISYRVSDEDMNVIMPLRNRSVPGKYVTTEFMQLYEKFDSVWKTHDDIFNVFRFIHQFYVLYVLDGNVKENVMDLKYLVNLQQFYSGGNTCNVITRLISDCDIRNSIDGMIEAENVKDDVIAVTIQSPKAILHQQIRYIMEFIDNYNDKGKLKCKLDILQNELFERNIISKEEEFANLKTIIDLRQFRLTKEYIICKR